jgi:hypothetical protein
MVTLPYEHHYVRYCKSSQMEDGKVLSLAFRLRDKDTDGLSGDHFEHYNNYKQILDSLTQRFTNKLSKNACFAKINCGEVINSAREVCEISFVKEDEKQPHTLMTGLTIGDDLIPALLVTLIKETIFVGAIK